MGDEVMKRLLQHYGNPCHVACRIVDVFIFFHRPANLREILATRPMVIYDRIFRAIAY